mgnify:CR=1 FL=1|tara:strand:- start:532 stop:1155 length:624 start_codon:yes stop_codon:yes gene_type:complete
MSEIKVDTVVPRTNPSTLTIGASGDTVTVPTGVGLTATDEVKTNKISPATGTAFTLGDSGDTFTVPLGATIANSGTATGFDPSDGSITVAKLSTSGTESLNVKQRVAKAWINYNFSSDSTRDSFNISSITDNGTGDAQFNFTSNLANANFAYTSLIPRGSGSQAYVTENTDSSDRTQTTSRAIVGQRGAGTGAYIDSDRIMMVVFGD